VHNILRFLRWSGRCALVLYFVLGLAWLGLRYAVLPQIDHWRGAIARQVSQTLGAQVELGAVHAEWLGLHPRLTLREVSIIDRARGERLDLPYLHATLGWRSLTTGRLQFKRLEVAGLDVTVRRDGQGNLWILDQALDPSAPQTSAPQMPVTQSFATTSVTLPSSVLWLLSQPRVDVSDVTLRWVDEQRQAPSLILHRARLQIRKHGDVHQLALNVSPSSDLASALDVRAELRLDAGLTAPLDVSRLRGRVYARLDALHPAAWRPWLDVPPAWRDGRVWAQTSLVLGEGPSGEMALNLRIEQGQWQWGEDHLTLDAARLHAQGAWSALARWLRAGSDVDDARAAVEATSDSAADASAAARMDAFVDASARADAPLLFTLQAEGLRVELPALFDEALPFDALRLAGRLDARADGATQLVLDAVNVVNADMDVAWQGDWRTALGTDIGMVDWRGRFQRLQVNAIVRYLPKFVSDDARAWMRVGLLAGQIRDADFTLRGDLMHFPFGDAPEQGDFSLRGKVVDGVIDYAATAAGKLPWPRLDDIQGRLDMRRVTLTLQADSAAMSPTQDLPPIAFAQIHANIPNIERDAQLTVQGRTRAPAASYLGLMRHSPLGERLDHVFAEATGSGEWELPLTLVVPLLHSLDLTVDGAVHFADASLQLMPQMPPFERLRGTVAFTHEAITAPKLNAHFLGDAVAISGGIGAQQSGLRFAGRVTSEALRDYVGVQGMQRLQGRAAYTASLERSPSNGFALDLASDLRGMALALPAPLGKSADAPLALQAHWGDAAGARNTAARKKVLDVRVGNDLRLRLLRRPDDDGAAYFHAGALTIAQSMPDIIPSGMWVDVHTAVNDASAWYRVVEEFSLAFSADVASAPAPARQLFPDLRDLRVRADQLQLFGLNMQDAVLRAVRTDALHWRIDVQSPQTEGTLTWRSASGDAAGHVQARFERLAIGAQQIDAQHADDASNAALRADEALNIPALDLHVRAFTLYGHRLGELSLTGVPQPDAWALESLRIAGDGATLQGRGVWRLRGDARGLHLDALATVSDMGAYLAQTGMDSVMSQGQGSVQGQFFWRDLPWRLELTNLQGTLDFQLDKGRFSRVNSRTARLLELLSIQSLQRLARLDWNLDGLVREGFPFDTLRGELTLQDGKLQTHDYRVIGPVGTIVISGTTDLQAQSQQLQALVIPNLDMSGAALLAGIAINPVVGVGAFLTQWLLKTPVENAMALEYRVGGTWDEPEIEVVARRTPQQAQE